MDKDILKDCVYIGLATAFGYGLFGKLGLIAVVIYLIARK